jgi:putative transposase
VLRPVGAAGFVVLPKRWVVERTFGGWQRYRRLAQDYEYLVENSEAMLYATMIHLLARRLQ